MNTLSLAKHAWLEVLEPDITVIDATCGNGHDLLWLAKHLQGKGKLIGYDVQQDAIDNTHHLLASLTAEERSIITLKHQSHETFDEKNARLIVYNLGYLPGYDKNITTVTSSTLKSMQSALSILEQGGLISITCYPGHEEGEKEEKALINFCASLSVKEWNVLFQKWVNRNQAPSLLLIRRK